MHEDEKKESRVLIGPTITATAATITTALKNRYSRFRPEQECLLLVIPKQNAAEHHL